jgi:nucleoside-diphosphate-sugar epimerase
MTIPLPTNPSSTGKRIAFTGGSGVVGRHVISSLLAAGHEVLNLDITPLANPAVHTIRTDITIGSQVFNALSSPFFLIPPIPSPTLVPDVLVHFAAVPRILIVPMMNSSAPT